jgi:hypothetical protein
MSSEWWTNRLVLWDFTTWRSITECSGYNAGYYRGVVVQLVALLIRWRGLAVPTCKITYCCVLVADLVACRVSFLRWEADRSRLPSRHGVEIF